MEKSTYALMFLFFVITTGLTEDTKTTSSKDDEKIIYERCMSRCMRFLGNDPFNQGFPFFNCMRTCHLEYGVIW